MKGKDMSKTMEAYLSMVSEAKAKLDPVDDKANDKKFKDRKDKDIDNDGDVDSSDKFLHKKRKAIDNEIDGGEKPADNAKPKKGVNPFKKEEVEIDEARQMKDPKKDSMVTKGGKTIVIDKSKEAEYLKKGWTLSEEKDEEEDDVETDKKPFPPKKKKPADVDGDVEEPEADGDSEIKKNPKTADKKAEISKIESVDTRSAFEKMWSEIVEATAPKQDGEKYDDNSSQHDKDVVKNHKKSDKKIEDGVEDAIAKTFKAGGKDQKQATARSGADNLKNGDKSPK